MKGKSDRYRQILTSQEFNMDDITKATSTTSRLEVCTSDAGKLGQTDIEMY